MHTFFPWQQTQWQRILTRYQNHTLPHAGLLAGPQGLGKTQFALAVAELVLCQAPPPLTAACGRCTACQLLQANTHPDLWQVQPEAEGKALRIDRIRQLIEALNTTARQSSYQVAIIEPAETLNVFAANALLKTLEEPPGKVIIILVSHRPQAVAATLRSRCQLLPFRVPPKDVSLTWLASQANEEVPGFHAAALNLAEGVPLTALRFIREQRVLKQQALLEQVWQLQQQPFRLGQWAAEFQAKELPLLLADLTHLVLDLLRFKNRLAPGASMPAEYEAKLQQLAHQWTLPQLFAFFDKSIMLQRCYQDGIHLNWQLAMEDLLSGTLLEPVLKRY